MIYRLYRNFLEKFHNHTYRKILIRYGISYANKIKTDTLEEELRTLYLLALKIREGGQGLEIGSYFGASTCYIVAGLAQRNGHLTCVDTWKNETMPEGEQDTLEEFTRNTYPIRQFITTIRKNSLDLSPMDFPSMFDYVFIDGNHSYLAVRNDFQLVDKITFPGAIVLFHDALYFEGVTQTIGEALIDGNWKIGGFIKNLFWIVKK